AARAHARAGRRGPVQGVEGRGAGSGRGSAGGPALMLYSLLYPYAKSLPVLNVFRYITFRTAMAAVTALFIALALGPPMIRLLRRRQIGQSIREAGPKSHMAKA